MKTVVLDVCSLEESLDKSVQAMESGRGEEEFRISFDSPELLWEVLSSKRWELLKALCGQGPLSIREAARRVGRDVKAVHSDVMALLKAGIINRTRSKQVEFPYDTVKVEFVLRAA